jgi:murein DD-endopeptidase MepM/ murein hydrolase activator NlpD
MIKKSLIIIGFTFFIAFNINAQGREKGKIKNSTVIKPDSPYYKDTGKKKDEFDFIEENVPKQILDKQYNEEKAPTIQLENRSVVSTIDSTNISPSFKLTEGKTDVIEVQEEMAFGETSEDWVKVADYFSIWDEKTIDPYDINAKEFEGPIVINLVDKENNRFSSSPSNNGPVTSKFGFRWGRRHTGVDIALKTGDPVYSAFDGIIRIAGYNSGGYGKFVVVRHNNGLETLYGHLSEINLYSNTIVKAGDLIGYGGSTGHSTGPHLHFETRYEGNPFDPTEVFIFPVGALKSDQLILSFETFNVARSTVADEYSAGAKVRYRKSIFVRVRPGDTLSSIANKFDISLSDLARKNKISVNGNLLSGKKLRIR